MSKEKNDPTPWLGKPTRDTNSFTYSENKLLDQITLEVMDAWKKDLRIIRKHHKEILDSEKAAVDLSLTICKEFPKLEKFLERNDFIEQFYDIKDKIEQVYNQQSIINKSLFNLETQFQREHYKYWNDRIENILNKIEQLSNINKKKWWYKFFKPKT